MGYIKKRVKVEFGVSKLVTIHYYEFASDYEYDGEAHDFWEIIYVDSGQITVECEGELTVLSQGQLFFIPPMDFHRLWCSGGREANIFVISFECPYTNMEMFFRYSCELEYRESCIITDIIKEAKARYNLMLDELIEFENAPFGGQQLISNWLENLLILLARKKEAGNACGHRPKAPVLKQKLLTAQIIEFLEANVGLNVTMDELCSRFHYGKTYLSRLFKNETGVSIMQYFRHIKVVKAKKLLRRGVFSYEQIAQQLSISSPQYFVRIFKKDANMTPREYLKSVRE